MLILLSPSKTMDFSPLDEPAIESKPQFVTEANQLAELLSACSTKKISKLMQTNDEISEQTYERFQSWKKRFNAKGTKQAIFAYQGDVYTGLKASQWTDSDLDEAQRRLRIISGMYGILRPADLIQPYRLEMKTELRNSSGKDLYQFWKEHLTQAIEKTLQELQTDLVCNLASNEYAKAIDFKRLGARVISPTFKEEKEGKLRFITVFGKQARGRMASYLVQRNICDEQGVLKFRLDKYRYRESASKPSHPVFVRSQP